MRVTVIVCDRCEDRITEGETVRVDVAAPSSNAGGRPLHRELDLCRECGDLALRFATRTLPRPARPRVGVQDAERELELIRTIAADAAEGWNVGDPPDRLLSTLRDVATAARR